MRKLVGPLTLAAGVALLCAGTAAAGNGGVGPVTPVSPNGERIADAYWLIMALTGGIFVLVEGALIVFLIRFRGRRRSRAVEGPQIRGNTNLELAWTVVPVLVLAAIAGFVFYKLPGIKNVPASARTLDVTVSGRQFYWQYTYPNGVIQVDELRVPVDRVVDLNVTAPSWDVIHSWWVPAFTGKMDAIPGKVNHIWFQVERPGTYTGRCAEFCGVQHAVMPITVTAVPGAEFDAWLSEQARGQQAGTSDLGAQEWNGVCAKCHGDRGQGAIGPPINGSFDANVITQTVQNGLQTGLREMPPVGKDWDDRQMNALLRYMRRNISAGGTAAGGG